MAAEHRFFIRTPLDLPILLLAFMVLVSLYATYDISVSLPKISGMVFGIGVYYAVVAAGRTPRGWRLGWALWLAAGAGVALLGLLGSKWMDKFPVFGPAIALLPTRLTGLPDAEQGFHPNEVAGTLVWVVPGFAALLAHAVRSFRGLALRLGRGQASLIVLLLFGGTALTAGVLLLTQSRGGLLGLVVGGLVMLFGGRRWRWLLLAGALAAMLTSWGARLGSLDSLAIFATRPGDASPGLSLDTLEWRFEVWARALDGIQDVAFTGMGMNTFRRGVHVLYPLFLVGPDVDVGHAHNEFLQAALDLGIPGLVAFVSLSLGAFWMLAELNARRARLECPDVWPAALGLVGGLLAHAVYGLTDAVALGAKPGVLWWWMLGLVAGLYAQPDGGGTQEQP